MDNDSHLRTRPSLLMRLRNRADADAWRAFVDLYTPVVYRFCRRRGLQEADAADVAQEVLAQVSQSAEGFTYDPQRGRFRDWLWAVVRSRLSRWHRRQSRQPASADQLDTLADAGSEAEWASEFQDQLTTMALQRVRAEFSDEHWSAFEKTWREEIPAATAARELGLTTMAVYVAKSRVLSRLRDEILHLAEELPFDEGGAA